VLDAYGLADLTMRRLAAELGVRPSALYHHFANKQLLLAAVADELLARGRAVRGEAPAIDDDEVDWTVRVTAICSGLRDSMLAYRDGAELVATVHAYRLGASVPGRDIDRALRSAGLEPELAAVATRALLHFVFGHVADEQIHLQASAAGAIEDAPRSSSDFELGLDLVIEGTRARSNSPLR
jgi:AcrR family transcriptional regulator